LRDDRPVLTAGLVLAGLAAALHVYIFYLESLAWTRPGTRAVFGTSAEEAEATRELAFNQGFYNLFLAVVTAVGIVLTAAEGDTELDEAGPVLVLAGVGSMVAAATVLVAANPARASAAIRQGLLPLLAVVAVLVGLA
jgi:putative membrane protein